jgi:hypothetical protein
MVIFEYFIPMALCKFLKSEQNTEGVLNLWEIQTAYQKETHCPLTLIKSTMSVFLLDFLFLLIS